MPIGRARWRLLKYPFQLVEAVEIVEIGEEDLRLDDLVERATCRFERLLEIFQYKAGLQLYIRAVVGKAFECRRASAGTPNLEIAGNLTRGEDGPPTLKASL